MDGRTQNPLTVLVVLGILVGVHGQTRLATMRAVTTPCDYLIVTPETFVDCAVRLAGHRNEFAGDDVSSARVVTMEDIEAEFDPLDTLTVREALWEALHYAWHTWPDSLECIVFMGDDKPGCCRPDTSAWSTGPVPTYIINTRIRERYDHDRGDTLIDTTHRFSDAFYYSIRGDSADLPYPHTLENIDAPILARIPCETSEQCERYVTKVIDFDLRRPAGPWRNRVLAFADDFYMLERPDPIYPPHYRSAEKVVSRLAGRWIDRLYTGEFARDDSGRHSIARDAFFERANHGNLWNIYFGHGHEWMLTDERFIRAGDWQRFTNDTMPGVYLSMSCLNGAFYREIDSSMCKQFLFAPAGGAIAYIASTDISYARENEKLAESLCLTHRQVPYVALGHLFHHVKTSFPNVNSNIHRYHFLGDPALRVSNPIARSRLETTGATIECLFPSTDQPSGSFRYTWSIPDSVCFPAPGEGECYVRDSILAEREGVFDGVITIDPPAHNVARLILYAWGEGFEARVDTLWRAGVAVAGGHKVRVRNVSLRLTGNRLHIECSPSLTAARLVLYDMRGRRLHASHLPLSQGRTTVSIPALRLPAGRVTARLETAEGTRSKTIIVIR
jgi:hypothetical protein